jgi:hypothetical protein
MYIPTNSLPAEPPSDFWSNLKNFTAPICIQELQDQLGEIEQGRVDGKFLDDQNHIAPGQAILNQLLRYTLFLKISDAHDLVTEMLVFQESEESRDAHPLSDRLYDLVDQAQETKKALIHYVAETTEEARRFSLSTVHALKNSLGMKCSSYLSLRRRHRKD